MKNILAVDTATKILTISLKSNNEFYEMIIDEGFQHSEKFIPNIEKILDRASIKVKDLDLLVCTRGPGSFTGLRISMATLKGINTALDIPLVSIPTLDVYADKKQFSGIVLPIIDARKKSFYTAIYRDSNKETKDLDLTVEDLLDLIINEKNILLTGPDANILYEKVNNDPRFILDNNEQKYGESLINLGLKKFNNDGPDSKDQGPLYIRKSDAEILLDSKK